MSLILFGSIFLFLSPKRPDGCATADSSLKGFRPLDNANGLCHAFIKSRRRARGLRETVCLTFCSSSSSPPVTHGRERFLVCFQKTKWQEKKNVEVWSVSEAEEVEKK